jgi:hypothetical protein
MNLADFPISALQRQQKKSAGQKLDRLGFEASRYDSASRRRVQQRVTLTSTARDGLPTPADEHVILALLYVAKHANNFTDPTVHFAPSQLFDIMGWAPNGRSYTRLRDVLRRLKSLTIRYENAWWDAAGRGYEEEVATGIVSAYRIARQVSGPRTAATALVSWVTWTPQFHESLQNGNIKRLNLDVFFSLSTPTAQRMYRFLDKRFYGTDRVSMDLVEFACGHVGLTDAGNVALLKRRLAPAIAELEKIGFIAPADASGRYQKVKAGVWRVVFRSAAADNPGRAKLPPSPEDGHREGKGDRAEAAEPLREGDTPDKAKRYGSAASALSPLPSQTGPAAELAREFYRQWNPAATTQPGVRDLAQAEALLGAHGEQAREVLACLVQVTRKEWPECRSLSGAAQKYLADAVKLHEQKQEREAARRASAQARQQARQQEMGRQQGGRQLQEVWDALPEAQREAVVRDVRGRVAASAPAAFVHRLCLEELGRLGANGSSKGGGEP